MAYKSGTNAILGRLAVSLAVAAAASAITWVAYSQTHAHSDFQSLTYDLVVRDFSYKDGAPVSVERGVRAIRQDGSHVEVRNLRAPDGSPYERREIEDLEKLQKALVLSGVDVTTTVPVSVAYAENARTGPLNGCGLGKNVERSRVLGYEVLLSALPEVRIGDGATSLSAERWLAPSLGCIPLRVTWKGGGKVVRVEEVENILLGEPDPSLFEIPIGYEEVSPGEAMRRLHVKFGTPAYNPSGHIERVAEERYLRRRAAAGL